MSGSFRCILGALIFTILAPLSAKGQAYLTDRGISSLAGHVSVVPRSNKRWFADVAVNGSYRGVLDLTAMYLRSSHSKGAIEGNGVGLGSRLYLTRLLGQWPVEGFASVYVQSDSYTTPDPTADLSGSTKGFEFGAHRKHVLSKSLTQVLIASFSRFKTHQELNGVASEEWGYSWAAGTSLLVGRRRDHKLVLGLAGIFQEDYQAVRISLGVVGPLG